MKKIIFLSLIILFFIKTQNISANQNTFAVDNILVKGQSYEQNNNSREKYLNIAFKTGFKNLVLTLLKKEDQKKILSTDLVKIKSLIENYSVEEENFIGKDYMLKLSIQFDKNKTKNFFYEKNIPYSESQNLDLLVYPIMILEKDLQVFSKNKFFEEWNDNKEFEQINFLLPVENIEDINFIRQNEKVLEEIDLERLTNNYQIKNNAVLIFRYNNKKLNVFIKSNLNGVKKNNNVNFTIDNLDNKEVRSSLVKSLKSYINELWKEENLINISTPASLTVTTKIKNSGTIEKIKSKLNNINFIESYSIQEIGKDLAKIKIRYIGKIKSIQDSFVRNGFDFQIINNEWILNLSS